MAGRRSSKGKCRSGKGRARRRVIGLGGSAGAFVAFGLSAPPAHADPLTDLIDLAIDSVASSAASAIPVDLLDPGALDAALAGLIPLSDTATVYDNSRLRGPRIIAQLSGGDIIGSPDWPAWAPAALQARWPK
jgi:hypothetical protein